MVERAAEYLHAWVLWVHPKLNTFHRFKIIVIISSFLLRMRAFFGGHCRISMHRPPLTTGPDWVDWEILEMHIYINLVYIAEGSLLPYIRFDLSTIFIKIYLRLSWPIDSYIYCCILSDVIVHLTLWNASRNKLINGYTMRLMKFQFVVFYNIKFNKKF